MTMGRYFCDHADCVHDAVWRCRTVTGEPVDTALCGGHAAEMLASLRKSRSRLAAFSRLDVSVEPIAPATAAAS